MSASLLVGPDGGELLASASPASGRVDQEVMLQNVERNTYLTLAIYLLRERAVETELRVAFAQLIEERHNHFHNKEVKWTECRNQKCAVAGLMLQAMRDPQVIIDRAAADDAKANWAVSLTRTPGGLLARLEQRLPEGVKQAAPESVQVSA